MQLHYYFFCATYIFREVPRLSLRRIIGKGGSKIKEITQEGKIWNFIEQPNLKGQSQTLIDLAVSKIKKLQ